MCEYKTIERLQCELLSTDTVLVYGDYVLAAYQTFAGYKAQIYMFVEKSHDIESNIELMANPDTVYEDGGHAIEWALQFISNLDE